MSNRFQDVRETGEAEEEELQGSMMFANLAGIYSIKQVWMHSGMNVSVNTAGLHQL